MRAACPLYGACEAGITSVAIANLRSLTELKETHLAPLTGSFGRSSSTSTIKGDSNGGGGDETPVAPHAPSVISAASTNGIGMTFC